MRIHVEIELEGEHRTLRPLAYDYVISNVSADDLRRIPYPRDVADPMSYATHARRLEIRGRKVQMVANQIADAMLSALETEDR